MAALKRQGIYRVEEDPADPTDYDNAETKVGAGAYLAIAKAMSAGQDVEGRQPTIPDDDLKRYDSGIRAKEPVDHTKMETIPAPPPLPARGSIPDLSDEADDSVFDPTKVLAQGWHGRNVAPADDESKTEKKPPVRLPEAQCKTTAKAPVEVTLDASDLISVDEAPAPMPRKSVSVLTAPAPTINVESLESLESLSRPESLTLSPLSAANVRSLASLPAEDSLAVITSSTVHRRRVSAETVVFVIAFLGALIPGLIATIYYLR